VKGGGSPLKGMRWLAVSIVLPRRGRRDPKETKTLRPLTILLALGAAGSFAAALVPGSNGARCVRRAVALGTVAIYAWMVV
jgi:hypothetical protein